MDMQKFRINYTHSNGCGGKTTGFKDIAANSASEARQTFNRTHASTPGYKVDKVTKK